MSFYFFFFFFFITNNRSFKNNLFFFLCRIADLDSPRDRIVQVCRWYLSAYHAGRKSAVAKKPYNPILGEVFQCYWDIPGKCNTKNLTILLNFL